MQTSIFDTPVERMSRTSDPATSKAAARAVKMRAGSQKMLLLREYAEAGEVGLIDESAARRARLDHTGYWKRCSELRSAGLIERTGITRTAQSGMEQEVCIITPIGHSALEDLNAG